MGSVFSSWILENAAQPDLDVLLQFLSGRSTKENVGRCVLNINEYSVLYHYHMNRNEFVAPGT